MVVGCHHRIANLPVSTRDRDGAPCEEYCDSCSIIVRRVAEEDIEPQNGYCVISDILLVATLGRRREHASLRSYPSQFHNSTMVKNCQSQFCLISGE